MTDTELRVRAYGKLMGWEFLESHVHVFNPDPARFHIQAVRPMASTLFFTTWSTAMAYIVDDDYRAQLEAECAKDV